MKINHIVPIILTALLLSSPLFAEERNLSERNLSKYLNEKGTKQEVRKNLPKSIDDMSGLPIDGIIDAYRDSVLKPEVTGVLLKIHAKEGTFVKKGEPIILLDNRTQKLEVAYQKLVLEGKRNEFQTLSRLHKESNSVSNEALMKKEIEFKLAKTDLEKAESQAEKYYVRAPYSGVVVGIFSQIGETSAPNQNLIRIIDNKYCRFTAYVNSKKIKSLRRGGPAYVKVSGHDAPVRGTVEFVSPLTDAASGLTELKVIFSNPQNQYRAGTKATLVI